MDPPPPGGKKERWKCSIGYAALDKQFPFSRRPLRDPSTDVVPYWQHVWGPDTRWGIPFIHWKNAKNCWKYYTSIWARFENTIYRQIFKTLIRKNKALGTQAQFAPHMNVLLLFHSIPQKEPSSADGFSFCDVRSIGQSWDEEVTIFLRYSIHNFCSLSPPPGISDLQVEPTESSVVGFSVFAYSLQRSQCFIFFS